MQAQSTGFEPAAGGLRGQVSSFPNEEPVAGAHARLRAVGLELEYSAETNANGIFELDHVIAGLYQLRVSKIGFFPAEMMVEIPDGGRPDLKIILEPAVTVSGEVGGVVTDVTTGDPITNALVTVPNPHDDLSLKADPTGVATSAMYYDYTDENGRYLIENLPPAEVEVRVQAPGYQGESKSIQILGGIGVECNFELEPVNSGATGTVSGRVTDKLTSEPIVGAYVNVEGILTFAPILTDDNGEYSVPGVPVGERTVHVGAQGYHPADAEVLIEEGQETFADFELMPRDTERGAIAGNIIDDNTEAPIGGAKVYYHRRVDDSLNSDGTVAAPWDWKFVESDSTGHYEIPAVLEGDYVMRVVKDGYYEAWREVEVESGQLTTANFRLKPRDNVEPGRIFGFVADALTSEPIAGATVYYYLLDDSTTALDSSNVLPDNIPYTKTGENGFYDTPPLRPGKYHMLVKKLGYESERAEVTVYSGDTTVQNFALTPLDTLEPGAIKGLVINEETGDPIPGAKVFYGRLYMGDSLPGWTHEGENDLTTLPYVETDDEGMFLIEDLRPGKWILLGIAEGFRRDVEDVEVQEGITSEALLELEPIVTPQPGSICGQLYNAVTDQVISDGYVFYAPVPHWMLDDNEAEDHHKSGDAHEYLNASGYDDHELLAMLGPESGVPFVQTDENGSYLIPELPPNYYVLVAWAPDHLPKLEIVEVQSGVKVEVNFPLESVPDTDPAVIEGLVSDAETGEGIGGAQVCFRPIPVEDIDDDDDNTTDTTLNKHDGYEGYCVLTSHTGGYRIELRPGSYRVVVRAEGYEPARRDMTVAAGEVLELNFELVPYVPPVPGTITGVVTDIETNEPIAGAWVFYGRLFDENLPLEWYLDEEFEFEHNGTTPIGAHGQYVRTNDNGEYVIENLRPGDWYLKCKAEGYNPARAKVELEEGETEIVDFALEDNTPEPGAIAGIVVDAITTEPLANAKVYYQRLKPELTEHDPRGDDSIRPTDVPATEPPFVLTDANGKYEIPELRPGRYRLMVVAEGYYPQGRVVAVVSGETTRAPFRMRPIETGTGTVYGVVRDAATSEPLVGASVWIVPAGEVVITDLSPQIILGEATTNEQGEYRIDEVMAGPIKVLAAMDGYRMGVRRAFLESGEEQRVNFRLQPIPTRPRGHLAGLVTDASTGEPIARALVTVIPLGNGIDDDNSTDSTALENRFEDDDDYELSRHPGRPHRTLTDENGQYVLRHLPVGFYKVRVAKRGYFKALLGVRIMAGEVTMADFALEPKPGQAFGSLTGVVLNSETESPIANAWVRYVPDESDLLTNRDEMKTRTNENGRFVFTRLPVGEGEVWGAKRGFAPDSESVEIKDGEVEVVRLLLDPIATTGTLAGVVSDALTDQPIAGALVLVPLVRHPYLANADNSLTGETDENGRYEIVGVPTGRRLVLADHPDYIADVQVTRVVSSGTTELDFDLLPWPEGVDELEIEVVSPTGMPLEGVQLRLPQHEWFEPECEFDDSSLRTNFAGRASFRGVPAGQWMLVASLKGFNPAFVTVTVEDSGEVAAKGDGTKASGSTLKLVLEPAAENAAGDWTQYE